MTNSLAQVPYFTGDGIIDGFDPNESWIQTYSGRRFNPTKPNPSSIVIQDVAHALSLQCRFSGHTRQFYSVAQHSVGVSYLCDRQDALWGLLHDASEAYLVDIPNPLKRSGKFDAYLDFEKNMMQAVCIRFNLPPDEPASVKAADRKMLEIEAQELMSPLRSDWQPKIEKSFLGITALSPQESKNLFIKRFLELCDYPGSIYEEYLRLENK